MDATIDISGLDKGSVLAALYNASRPQGLGFLHYDPKPMTPAQGTEILKEEPNSPRFDYLNGRVLKIRLDRDALDPVDYDRDNGQGAAAKAIAALRQSCDVNSADIQQIHHDGKRQAASITREELGTPTVNHGYAITMGLAGFADELGLKINEAIGHENQ